MSTENIGTTGNIDSLLQSPEVQAAIRAASDLGPIEAYVIVLKRRGAAVPPRAFADIVGGRIYQTAEDAIADIKNTGLTVNDVGVFRVDVETL
jgi:hypothetical protein